LNTQVTVPSIIRNGLDFLIRGKGAATSTPTHAFVFGQLADDHPRPDYELYFGPFGLTAPKSSRGPALLLGASPMKEPAIFVGVAACHSTSRGTVRLRSAAPDDPPVITHQLLTGAEIAIITQAGRRAREILAAPAFKPYVVAELAPGPDVDSDEAWEAAIRASARGGHHPIGTCKMGTDPEAVVNPELAVNGVEGLRVADASVMPTLVSGHTNAAAVMIGERAADLIRNA
jgi:choline dehydrogenase